MAKLIALLSSIALLLGTAHSQSESTFFYHNFENGQQPTTLTYQGRVSYPTGGNYLRLTPLENGSVGRVKHTDPVLFKAAGGAQADFQTSFKFLITPRSGQTEAGEGIVFFMGPVGSLIPSSSSGGLLGVYPVSWVALRTLVIEFDIVPNEDWDPNFPHIGINLQSVFSSNVTDVGSALVGQVVSTHIGYSSVTKMIDVVVSAGDRTFEVSTRYDLGTLLDDQVQVGLSASTGYTVGTHDIFFWNFYSDFNNGNNIRQVV